MRFIGRRSEHTIALQVDAELTPNRGGRVVKFVLSPTTITPPLSVVQYRPSAASTKARPACVELFLKVLAVL
jgi:hypothetical protein